LKSLSEKYERTYGSDNDYGWTKLKEGLELGEDGMPIIRFTYKGGKKVLNLSDFNSDDETETPAAEPKPERGATKKVEASEEDAHSSDHHWGRVFGRDYEDDDDERPDRKTGRESASATEVSGCPIPEHDNRPSSGERAFGIGALTLFGIGASVLAGINTSYLHKERKSLRHQMERASANGDSPFLYHGAYAALNYQNPLGGLGETLGPISMAISSILMGGDRGYMSQMEYLRNQRLGMYRDLLARASASASGSVSKTVTFEKDLQSLESGLGGIISQLNNGVGGLNDTIRNLVEQARKEQAVMNRTAQFLTNAGQALNARSSVLSGILEIGDSLAKRTAEAEEAIRNGDQALRDSGADKLTTQFTDNVTFNSSSSGNRSGLTTGPNGFRGAPGFPQAGGGFGLQFGGRFGHSL
jgi:hypothetical protein